MDQLPRPSQTLVDISLDSSSEVEAAAETEPESSGSESDNASASSGSASTLVWGTFERKQSRHRSQVALLCDSQPDDASGFSIGSGSDSG